MKYIIIPFGGGNKFLYESARNYFPEGNELIPYDLPGRGSRVKESIETNIDLVIDDFFDQLSAELDTPFALYGHCLGAVMSFSIAQACRERGLRSPCNLFLSGAKAPSLFLQSGVVQPDIDVAAFLINSGVPEPLVANASFMDMMSPIVKADYRMYVDYKYREAEPLGVPIHLLVESQVDVDDSVRLWQRETTLPINIHEINNIKQLSEEVVGVFLSQDSQ